MRLREFYASNGMDFHSAKRSLGEKKFRNDNEHHQNLKDFIISTQISDGGRHRHDHDDSNNDIRWAEHRHSAADEDKTQVKADTSRDWLTALDVPFDHVSSPKVEFLVEWWTSGFSDNPSLSTAAEDHSPIVEWCASNHARLSSTLLRYNASNFRRRRSDTEVSFLRLSIFKHFQVE